MDSAEALPDGWKSAVDPKGRVYYYNRELSTKQWQRPQPKVQGFHRQSSSVGVAAAAGGIAPARSPPPLLAKHRSAEPGLATALAPLLRDLRPRLLWALVDAHRARLELAWPELALCYRPPPPDGDTATTERLALGARQHLAERGAIGSPQLSGFLRVARGDARGGGTGPVWHTSWVQLRDGCVQIDALRGDADGGRVELGPRWRAEEVALPGGSGAGIRPVAGFRLWERGSGGAEDVYFSAPDNAKRWVLDLRTAALASAHAALTPAQQHVERAFQLAVEGLSVAWPSLCEPAAAWGTLSGAETAWELCAALNDSGSSSTADLAEQLWSTVMADAAAVQRRASALDAASSRQAVVEKQEALVASVQAALTPAAGTQLRTTVAPQLAAALNGLVQPLASSWTDLAPHIPVLDQLFGSLGGSRSPDPQACIAFRDAIFAALEELRKRVSSGAASGDLPGGEATAVLRSRLLPSIILAARAACSYIPVTDVLRAVALARNDALGLNGDDQQKPGGLASPGMLSPLQEGGESDDDEQGTLNRTESGSSVAEFGSSLQSRAVDQACQLAQLVSLCQAASLVGRAGQPARQQVQQLGQIVIGALSAAAGAFGTALEEGWLASSALGRARSPMEDHYMEYGGARRGATAQAAAEAASDAALKAFRETMLLLATRWLQGLVADVAAGILVQSMSAVVDEVAAQVASSNACLEQHLLDGFGLEVTKSTVFGHDVATAVVRDIAEVSLHAQVGTFCKSIAQASSALAAVLSPRSTLQHQQSPNNPALPAQQRPRARTAAEEWRVAKAQHGRPYYWNRCTNETRWADPRGWLATAQQVVFTEAALLGFAVEARQERSSTQDWMRVSRVDAGGQADRLGVVVGVFLYKVQGVPVPGLDRRSVSELVTELRPLTAVFVKRDDTDFELPASSPAFGGTQHPMSDGDIETIEDEEEEYAEKPLETSALVLDIVDESTVRSLQTPAVPAEIETPQQHSVTPTRRRVATEPPRTTPSKKRRKGCCCGSRPASCPPQERPVDAGSSLARLDHLVPPTPTLATAVATSPARSRVIASPPTALSPSSWPNSARDRAATEQARASNEAAAAARAAEAVAVEAAAKLRQAASQANATVDALVAVLRQHPLLPSPAPGGGKPQRALKDARAAVEDRIRALVQYQHQIEVASTALKRALWLTDLPEMKNVLDAYKALSTQDAGVQQYWGALKERHDEHNEQEQEALAALQSTKVIAKALLSDDVAEMLEVLEDHRGWADPAVEEAWKALREKVDEKQRQQEQGDLDDDNDDDEDDEEPADDGPPSNEDDDGLDGVAADREASAMAEIAARRDRREARRKEMDGRQSMRSASGGQLDRHRSAESSATAELQSASRSNEVERMVRALAKHKGSSVPAHQPLLQQLQQRVQAEAAKNKEDEQRREARRVERKARVVQLRQDMMMRTPARAPKPAPDLIAHKQPPPSNGNTKADRGGRVEPSPKSPDEAFLSRFDVKGSLGQGGFGEVLACWDNKQQRRVAVKVVRAEGR